MNPTAQAPNAPQRVVSDVAGPAPPNLVGNIPVHNPGQGGEGHDDGIELDKLMQDVGREMHKDSGPHQKHHFWEVGHRRKNEARFSTQMSIKNAPQPAAAKPQPAHQPPPVPSKPAAPSAQAPHNRVKPIAQTTPKPSKQHHFPVAVTILTFLVTAALIAAAYQAYK